MKIATWNVNSIRARLDQVLDWVETHDPDIVCLQETKVTDQEFPEDEFGDLGYDVVYTGQRSYNGVAIAAKDELQSVVAQLPGDDSDEQRRMIAATIDGIRIISVYVPNGKTVGAPEYHFKLKWLGRLRKFLDNTASPSDSIVICGDFNICPEDFDAYDERLADSLFMTRDERAAYDNVTKFGLTDAYRHVKPHAKKFTWWDYRDAGFEKNAGLRIDHFLVSQPVLDRVTEVVIDTEERATHNASDHAPVELTLS